MSGEGKELVRLAFPSINTNCHAFYSGIIIGASSLAQLKTNCAYLKKGPLPEDVLKALDTAWRIAKAETPEYWHLKLEYSYDTQKSLFQ